MTMGARKIDRWFTSMSDTMSISIGSSSCGIGIICALLKGRVWEPKELRIYREEVCSDNVNPDISTMALYKLFLAHPILDSISDKPSEIYL